MTEKTLRIKNAAGLQVELVGKLCKTAEQYESRISFRHKGGIYNAKSFLSVLGAGVRFGDELTFVCEGADEADALIAIEALVNAGFGE